MNHRRMFGYLSEDEIPSSAIELTPDSYDMTFNVMYVPVYGANNGMSNCQTYSCSGASVLGSCDVVVSDCIRCNADYSSLNIHTGMYDGNSYCYFSYGANRINLTPFRWNINDDTDRDYWFPVTKDGVFGYIKLSFYKSGTNNRFLMRGTNCNYSNGGGPYSLYVDTE